MRTKIFILALSIMVVSCYSQEECVVYETNADTDCEFINGEIPFSRAITNAEFVYKNIEGLKYKPRKIKSIEVLTKSDLRKDTRSGSSQDEEYKPLAYVVNYDQNSGYAILAADVSLPPVIGIGDHGNFILEEFVEFITNQNDTTTRSVSDENPARDIQYAIVNNSLHLPSINMENLPLASADTMVIMKNFPLLPTKWGQEAPYNHYAPLDSLQLKSVAGCVPVAAAQVLTSLCYHHNWRPTTPISDNYPVDWYMINRMIYSDIFKFANNDTSAHALNTASLIRAIGEYVCAEYSSSKTGAFQFILSEMYEAIGMNSSWYGDINNITKDDILNMVVIKNYPVHVGATSSLYNSGHAFVIDGWLRLQYSLLYHESNLWDNSSTIVRPNNSQFSFDLVHVNFGWYGNQDGYFLFDAINLTDDEYYEYAEENDNPYKSFDVYDLNAEYLVYDL